MHDQHLEVQVYVADAFLPARQGTILNSHRAIGIATNNSMVIHFALVTYIMMTADIALPDAVSVTGR